MTDNSGNQGTERGGRALEWTIIGSLLAVVIGIPAYQAIREAQTGNVPHLFRLFTTKPTKQALHAWDQENRDRSSIAKAVRSNSLQLQYDWFGDAGAKAIEGTDNWLFYRPDVEYLMQPTFTDERFYLGSFDTVVAGKRQNLRNPLVAIRDVNDQLAKRGIKLIVVPIPGKPSIYPAKLSGSDIAIENSPTLVLLDSLRQSGVATVDLVHALRAAREKAPVDLYLHRDTHWAPAGLAVAADEISKALLAIPEIPSNSNPSRYGAKDTTIERWGDICEMTSLPNRRSIWKTESVVASQVRD
ncbi:MAG: hypothetical protein RL173_1723, partial [Fibrobacterota bacterium]